MIVQLARVVGILTSLGTLALYLILVYANPYVSGVSPPEPFTPVLEMMLLAVAGLVVALLANPYLMLVIFILSFFPLGFYMLGTPGIFRWIGIFNLLYLVVTLPLLIQRLAVLVERMVKRLEE